MGAHAGEAIDERNAAGDRMPTGGPIVRVSGSGGLTRIHDPDVDLVLWERRLSADLENWLLFLDTARLPRGRVLVTRSDLRKAIRAMFAPCGGVACLPAATLAQDIHDLAMRFSEIAGNDPVDLRLEAVEGDSCWKFHRDHVSLRLLTTYRGPGTQYVTPENAEDALRDQRAYGGPVEHIPEHAISLFKGTLDTCSRGIVHRSPPIAGSGLQRLLLCLNRPSAASPPLWTRRSGGER